MADFDFGEEIGYGGGGIVKEAMRLSDDWRCAAKFISEPHSTDDLKRFKNTIPLLNVMCGDMDVWDDMIKIISTYHIVPIVAVNFNANPPWYIMPRALYSFHDLLVRSPDNHAPLTQRLLLFTQAALGVRHAHSKGIIHRDIKPRNVLLFDISKSICAAISDFEIGRLQKRDILSDTPSGQGLGSPNFAAPEQLEHAKHVDSRADIYSLGKMLYEAVTLRRSNSFDLSIVPESYRPIVAKATRDHPDQRYQTVSEMLEAISLTNRG